jgi:hypothetical protein
MSNDILMEFLKIIVGVIVVVVGWVIAHHFTSKRDIQNSQRAIRNQALTEAYKVLVRAGINGFLLTRDDEGKVINGAKTVEDALSIIHLYGTQEQSVLASKYANEVSSSKIGSSTQLVNSLRKSIRENLGGKDLEHEPVYLKVTYKQNEPNK